jgi:hypothetical protein
LFALTIDLGRPFDAESQAVKARAYRFASARRGRVLAEREAFQRRLRIEPLEDRRLLSLGDLLYTLDDPSTTRQDMLALGEPLASDGDLTVAGIPAACVRAVQAGCAYVLNSTTGTLVATLNNPTPVDGDNFGRAVAVSGTTVVVGAAPLPFNEYTTRKPGSAFVFDATTGNRGAG